MKKVSLIVVLMLTMATVQATTFHGDEQRTGNFTASSEMIPVLAWKTEITGLVGSSPVYYNGHIYVTNWYGWGSWSPGLYSLDADTGAVEWRNSTITGASSVAVLDGKLVVGSLSGTLYFVDASTGNVIKAVKLESSPAWWGIASSPLVYNGSVYVTTFSNGTLWKLNQNGDVLWHYSTGGEISHYTSPAAYNGVIFFAGNESGQHELVAIDESGQVMWKFQVDGKITNSPSIGAGKVFIATDSKLYAINLDGSEAWSVSFSGTMSTAAIAYGKLYIGSSDGLYCFDTANGNQLWKFEGNGKVDSSPAVAGNVVYFATNTPEGTIYALDASTGNVLWYYRLKPPSGSYYNIMSSPFIANDRLYIGADSGYVYCFNTTGKMEFNVSLIPGKFTVTVNGNNYRVNRATALGALYAAQIYTSNEAETYFNITLTYFAGIGFFVDSIMGFGTVQVGGGWIYWSIWNESQMQIPVSADSYLISGNETVYYCYGDGSSLSNCTILLKINAQTKPAGISSLEVSSGTRGGNVTAWVNVTSAESDWYVLVVSGVDSNGNSLAGISTFYLTAGQELKVPVLIHVPQLTPAGIYSLYAGVYRYDEYPENPIHVYGPETAEVS